MPTRAKWHHYVPRFHLRLFAADPQQRFIYAHDKHLDHTTRKSIKKVAATHDYYTVRKPDGALSDEVEHAFAQLEAFAAPVLKRLATALPGPFALPDEDRISLGAYIALQHARVPARLEPARQLSRFTDAIFADMELQNAERYRVVMREAGNTATDEELDAAREEQLAALRRGDLVVEHGPEAALDSIRIALETVGPLVASMNFTVFRRDSRPHLVLGDSPVGLQLEGSGPGDSFGFGTDGVEITMPLSPNNLLVATAKDHEFTGRVVESPSKQIVELTNVHSWASAVDAVYGHSTAAVHAARVLVPEGLRGYREPEQVVDGGPADWEGYKPASNPWTRRRPTGPRSEDSH